MRLSPWCFTLFKGTINLPYVLLYKGGRGVFTYLCRILKSEDKKSNFYELKDSLITHFFIGHYYFQNVRQNSNIH